MFKSIGLGPDGKTVTSECSNLSAVKHSLPQGCTEIKVYHFGRLVEVDLGECPTLIEVEPSPLLLWTGRLPLRGMPAKKTTAGGKFSEEAKTYNAYKDKIRKLCTEQGFSKAWDVHSVRTILLYALPKTCFAASGRLNASGWELAGAPYRSVPDIDNVSKPLMDALIPINDSGVYRLNATKLYGHTAEDAVIIQVEYRDRPVPAKSRTETAAKEKRVAARKKKLAAA